MLNALTHVIHCPTLPNKTKQHAYSGFKNPSNHKTLQHMSFNLQNPNESEMHYFEHFSDTPNPSP